MVADVLIWPTCDLTPARPSADPVPFTRSNRSIGGVERATRTDRGYWAVSYDSIVLRARNRDQWRIWQAIRSTLGGRAGLIAVPVPASLSAPYLSGRFEKTVSTTHDDDTTFDDGSTYEQGAIDIRAHEAVAIGAGTIRLRIVQAEPVLSGVRFSYQHALYETGRVVAVDGDVWTMEIFPTVRAPIPADALLEFDKPTCLCRLASDREMNLPTDLISRGVTVSVSFNEATDYWNDLALA